jgi:hypothetical protein
MKYELNIQAKGDGDNLVSMLKQIVRILAGIGIKTSEDEIFVKADTEEFEASLPDYRLPGFLMKCCRWIPLYWDGEGGNPFSKEIVLIELGKASTDIPRKAYEQVRKRICEFDDWFLPLAIVEKMFDEILDEYANIIFQNEGDNKEDPEEDFAERQKVQELELTDEMIARIDEIDNAVFECVKVLSEKYDMQWDMGVIGPVTDVLEEKLKELGFPVRRPAIVTDPDGTQRYEEYI